MSNPPKLHDPALFFHAYGRTFLWLSVLMICNILDVFFDFRMALVVNRAIKNAK